MPLMPWQQHVVDVAFEIDPDTGLLVYREVDLTVPRQSGKTSLILAVMVHRALGFGQDQNMVYTAQTRNDARRKWENDHVKLLDKSPFKSLYTVKLTNGNEGILWQNGSRHGITASGETSGHGETLDLGVIDEAFAHEDSRVEQGLSPTMITRPQPQLWVPSTAGTAKSIYLRKKVDDGRARVDLGLNSGVAYFEWSAPPGTDPADQDARWTYMPALGHTIRPATIQTEFERMDLSDYRRAYMNQWPDDSPDEWLVIPQDSWEAVRDEESKPTGRIVLSIDMNPDRSFAAMGIAGVRSDGLRHVEVAEHRRGTGWVVPRALEIVKKNKPIAVVIDGAGPAGSLIAPLEAAGIEIVKPSARDAMQACGQFYDAVCDTRALRHRNQPPLNAALAGADRRPLGDGWAWARKGLSADISPLVAVTLAAWGYETHAHLNRPRDVAANIW